jgi:hypothetical protein
MLHWADAKERGVLSLTFGLGQVRKSVSADLTSVSRDRTDTAYFGANDHALTPLHETFRQYSSTIERQVIQAGNTGAKGVAITRAGSYTTRGPSSS